MTEDNVKPKIKLNISTGAMIQIVIVLGAILFFIFHEPKHIDTRNIPLREVIRDEDEEIYQKYRSAKREKIKKEFEDVREMDLSDGQPVEASIAWPLLMKCVADFSWSERRSRYFLSIDEGLQLFFWGRWVFVFTPKYGGRHEVFSKFFPQQPLLTLEKKIGFDFGSFMPQRRLVVPSIKDYYDVLFTRGRGIHVLSRFADSTKVLEEYRFIQDPLHGASIHPGALKAMEWEIRHQLQGGVQKQEDSYFFKQCSNLVNQPSQT